MTTTETELNIGKKKGQVLLVVLLVVLADWRRKVRRRDSKGRTDTTTTTPLPRGLGHLPTRSGMPAFYSLVA